jgi:DNA processing protein
MEESYYNAVAVHVDGDRRALRKLRRKFGSWESAFEHLARAAAAVPEAAAEWEKLERNGVRLILADSPNFPPLLREITDPPFGIYARGDLAPITTAMARDARACAVVGTRRATPEGKNTAQRFARELARAGFVIVSGLAFGIDAAAHEGALADGGAGATVAVLAGGLHDVYPRENGRLAEQILAQGGALVSEYPLGCPPYANRFLERNRLISGLARGTLIVEAPAGSGSLATARFATEEGRDVFVVPGPITHPNYEGSHALIRQGAELVTRPEEILEAYGVRIEEKVARAAEMLPREERQILEALATFGASADVDKISVLAKLEPRIVNRALAFLVAKNIVKEVGGGYTI